ncbi:MAG: hypothetical protein ACMXX8_01655, partial [Candidatus Woesearchaeota archaeon]
MVIKNLLKKIEINEITKNNPKHISIVVSGIRDWSNENKKEINDALMISKKNLFQLLNNQIEYNIPIIS